MKHKRLLGRLEQLAKERYDKSAVIFAELIDGVYTVKCQVDGSYVETFTKTEEELMQYLDRLESEGRESTVLIDDLGTG